MQKQEGKDYWAYEGVSQKYANHRPVYPPPFLNMLLEKHTSHISKDVCVDIATGTGFLAGYLADSFGKVVGMDLSEAQIAVA